MKLHQTCSGALQNLLQNGGFDAKLSCLGYKRILAAVTAKEFLLQVTVGVELVSILSLSRRGNKTLASFEGRGRQEGRQLVPGTVVLLLMVTGAGLFLPLCVCPKSQL